MVKNPPAMQGTQVQSLGQRDPLEEGIATHSSILAWRIPQTEEPGGLQSMGSHRVGHDWGTERAHTHAPSLTVSTANPGLLTDNMKRSENETVSHSVVSNSLRPHGLTEACQVPLSMEFSRQEYWSGLPFPFLGDLPNPGIKPRSPALQADSLPSDNILIMCYTSDQCPL